MKIDGILMCIGIILVIGLTFFGLHLHSVENARLMAECRKDHKEYECVAMLNKGDVMPFIPVIINQ